MDFYQTMISRRSCKSFVKGKRVSDDELDKILTAGTFAPSGKGWQSATIVLVNDDETVQKLSKLNASILGAEIDPFYGAPTVAIVFANPEYPTYIYDGSLVMGNLLNMANALNVGACWIHRAKEMFKTEEGKLLMKKWGVPENYEGIGNCILGVRAGEPTPAKPRKSNYIIKV